MNFKKMIVATLVAFSVLTLVNQAQAQLGAQGRVSAITFSGTTNIAGASTNTYAAGLTNYIPVESGDVVAVSWRFKHVAANTGANVLTFSPAVEDGKPDTRVAQTHRFIVAANGNTEVVGVTNFTVYGASRLYLTSSEIPAANGITNSTLSYRVQPRR